MFRRIRQVAKVIGSSPREPRPRYYPYGVQPYLRGLEPSAHVEPAPDDQHNPGVSLLTFIITLVVMVRYVGPVLHNVFKPGQELGIVLVSAFSFVVYQALGFLEREASQMLHTSVARIFGPFVGRRLTKTIKTMRGAPASETASDEMPSRRALGA
jgi:hypothetical protein